VSVTKRDGFGGLRQILLKEQKRVYRESCATNEISPVRQFQTCPKPGLTLVDSNAVPDLKTGNSEPCLHLDWKGSALIICLGASYCQTLGIEWGTKD